MYLTLSVIFTIVAISFFVADFITLKKIYRNKRFLK